MQKAPHPCDALPCFLYPYCTEKRPCAQGTKQLKNFALFAAGCQKLGYKKARTLLQVRALHAFGKLQIEKAGDVPSGKDIGVRVGIIAQGIVTGEVLDIHSGCTVKIQTGNGQRILERQGNVFGDLNRRSGIRSQNRHTID